MSNSRHETLLQLKIILDKGTYEKNKISKLLNDPFNGNIISLECMCANQILNKLISSHLLAMNLEESSLAKELAQMAYAYSKMVKKLIKKYQLHSLNKKYLTDPDWLWYRLVSARIMNLYPQSLEDVQANDARYPGLKQQLDRISTLINQDPGKYLQLIPIINSFKQYFPAEKLRNQAIYRYNAAEQLYTLNPNDNAAVAIDLFKEAKDLFQQQNAASHVVRVEEKLKLIEQPQTLQTSKRSSSTLQVAARLNTASAMVYPANLYAALEQQTIFDLYKINCVERIPDAKLEPVDYVLGFDLDGTLTVEGLPTINLLHQDALIEFFKNLPKNYLVCIVTARYHPDGNPSAKDIADKIETLVGRKIFNAIYFTNALLKTSVFEYLHCRYIPTKPKSHATLIDDRYDNCIFPCKYYGFNTVHVDRDAPTHIALLNDSIKLNSPSIQPQVVLNNSSSPTLSSSKP